MEIKDLVLDTLNKSFKLNKLDIKKDSILKKNGMKFYIDSYEIEGIGHLCILSMKAMLGLMKMDTIILTINKKDVPLFNVDFIKAFNNNVLLVELYDDMINPYRVEYLAEFQKIKDNDKDIDDYKSESHWYDSILYKESYHKKGKKLKNRFVESLNNYLNTFINQVNNIEECNYDFKYNKVEEFANKLYTNGGPAVNKFKELFGEEVTKKVVLNHMYGLK